MKLQFEKKINFDVPDRTLCLSFVKVYSHFLYIASEIEPLKSLVGDKKTLAWM